MVVSLIRKTSVIWWMLVLSGMAISCSNPVRESGRVDATVQEESGAADMEEEDAVQSYLGHVFQKLESHKRYPSIMALSGLNGRVVLRFTVRRDGEVIDPQITEVTGHESFGNAALQALRRVGQLPPFPDEIRRHEILVEVPMTYRLSVSKDDAEDAGAARAFLEWATDDMKATMGEASAALKRGSKLGFFVAWQRHHAKIRSLAEEGNAYAQDFLAGLQRNYSELGAKLGIDADTLEFFLASTFGSGEQQTETWHCFKLFDRHKAMPLFTLIRMGIVGEVAVAGTAHMEQFQVDGLDRRWDWNCDEKMCRYSFSISPDGTGRFYDFSVSDDGRAKPRQVFECQLSP